MHLDLIGFPMDLGAGRRGVDMGTNALRIAGLAPALRSLGHEVVDHGNVEVPQPETESQGNARARFLPVISEACRRLYRRTSEVLAQGGHPILLGGDHSMAMGSIAAVSDHCRAHDLRLGVIWLDAHGDMNTPQTTPSGNIHGMPLAVLLGFGPDELTAIAQSSPALHPPQVSLIGIRSLDGHERRRIHESGVGVWTMRAIDEMGMVGAMREVIRLARTRSDWLHVSFDVDFLDPAIAPGVGTRVPGGPSFRESHLVMEMLCDSGLVRSVDVTELNPILDHENKTAEVSVDLLCSLFGRKIL